MARMSDEEIRWHAEHLVEGIQVLDFDEDDGQRLAIALVDEVFQLEPGVREHFSDALIGELKEEISRDDTEFSAACRNAIMEVEQRWRNRA